MVKDHSNCERGNPLPPQRLLFPISSKGSFICITSSHRQDNTYHSVCYTSHGLLAGTWNTYWSTMKDRSDDPSHHDRTLLPSRSTKMVTSLRYTNIQIENIYFYFDLTYSYFSWTFLFIHCRKRNPKQCLASMQISKRMNRKDEQR